MAEIEKDPNEVLADINSAICALWKVSGFAALPKRMIVPKVVYDYCSSHEVQKGMNLLEYIKQNSMGNIELIADSQ